MSLLDILNSPTQTLSHIVVAELIFSKTKIQNVLEFGMGQGSTLYYLNKGCCLTSIEHDKHWIDTFQAKDPYKHKVYQYPIGAMGSVFDNELKDQIFDLILIDNYGNDRVKPAQKAFGKSDIILWHDTQDMRAYGWDKVKVPPDYREVRFTFSKDGTTLWIREGTQGMWDFYFDMCQFTKELSQYLELSGTLKLVEDMK